MNRLPLVSILTLNYNSVDDTLELLGSIYKGSYTNFEIILVDNDSEHFDTGKILEKYPEVKIVESHKNLGFAGGNNFGLPSCSGEYILFLNNDTIVAPTCLETLINTIASLDKFGAISPKFHYYHTPKLIEYAGCPRIDIFTARTEIIGSRKFDDGNYEGLIETAYAHGGGMLVPRTVINDVGEMFEGFFLYYEELDWSERMNKAGYKIYCQRNALVYHKESASVGRSSPLKVYYMNRSRLLFMRRNFGGINLMFFYLYFTLVSFPKNVLKFLFFGKRGHLNAYIRSILWQFDSRFEFID